MNPVTVSLSPQSKIEHLNNTIQKYCINRVKDPLVSYYWEDAIAIDIVGNIWGEGALAYLNLPGKLGDIYRTFNWEDKKRLLFIKGHYNNNVVLTDRDPLDVADRSTSLDVIVGGLYAGLAPNTIHTRDTFEDIVDLPLVVEKTLKVLRELEQEAQGHLEHKLT